MFLSRLSHEIAKFNATFFSICQKEAVIGLLLKPYFCLQFEINKNQLNKNHLKLDTM